MKLFISSLENGKYINNIKLAKKYKILYALYSFLYIKKKKDIKVLLNTPLEVMIDSGAHTFQKEGQDTDFDKFVYDYIKFINKYDIKLFVELDIENKVGLKQVEKWNKEIIKKTGKKPIAVWHRERGWDYYKWMCKNYDYVGFSGFVVDDTGQPEVPDRFINLFCDTAHKYRVKIHGFGYTRKDVKKYRFDSVDSASWTSGRRFGSLHLFDGRGMVQYRSVKNFSKIYHNIEEHQIREWIKYQHCLDKI